MSNNIKITQNTNEILLTINVVAEVKDIYKELEEKIPKLKEFYQTAKTPIRVTGKLFTETEQKEIAKIINKDIEVKVNFDDEDTLLGLHAIKKTFQTKTEVTETKIIENSIRSGQKEEYSGSLVIIGDVNPGGQVIAGGNIIVVGTLRGLAHAGANGNLKAIITANTIENTQLRIANQVKEVEEKKDKCPICKIEKNEIVVK